MTFEAILPRLRAGQIITRSSWANSLKALTYGAKVYLLYHADEPVFRFETDAGDLIRWVPTTYDILAGDWMVLK